jgi:hypothetical protein
MTRSLVLALLLCLPTLAQAQDSGAGPSLDLHETPRAVSAGQVAATPTTQQSASAVAAPGFVLRLHAGGQFGDLSVYGRRSLLYYGRAGLALGHELVAFQTDIGRMFLSIEYDGSVSANHLELIHRHGATLTLGFPSVYLSLGGGVAIGHVFQNRAVGIGGHFSMVGGFRFGNFLMAIPFDVDVFGPAVGVTAGFSLGVTTS